MSKEVTMGIEFSEPPTRCADQNCAMVKEVIGCALHDFRMTTAAKRIFLLKVATFAAELMEAYRPIPENEGGSVRPFKPTPEAKHDNG